MLVDVKDMTDEEMSNYLEGGIEEESNEEADSEAYTAEEFSEEEEYYEAPEEEEGEVEETDSEEEAAEEEPQPQVNPDDKIKDLEEQLEKARAEKGGLESVLGRQGKELGDLRKKIEELKSQLEKEESLETQEEINNKLIENPYQATLDLVKKERILEEKKTALLDLQKQEYRKSNELVVRERIPHFDELKEDIAAILKEDSVEEDVIKEVMSDLFAENAAILIQIAKRAETAKKNRELEERLNKEHGKHDRILNNVAKATKQSTLSAKTAGATPGTGALTAVDVRRMTSEQIDALYAKVFNT